MTKYYGLNTIPGFIIYDKKKKIIHWTESVIRKKFSISEEKENYYIPSNFNNNFDIKSCRNVYVIIFVRNQ